MHHFYILAIAAALLAAGCGGRHAPPSGAPLFVHVTEEAGLSSFVHETGARGEKWFPETMGAGGGFIDFDGDGWQDILLVGGGAWDGSALDALQLFRNDGDGTFSDATEQAGLGGLRAYGFGISVADVDSDGDDDFYFTTLGGDYLFINRDGRFIDATAQAGIPADEAWSTAAIFFDPDRDLDADLYVGRYVAWAPENDKFCSVDGRTKDYCTPGLYDGLDGVYLENLGDGTFVDRTQEAGFSGAPGKALGLSDLDFNEDGWTDVAVANDLEPDLLFENQKDGTFREVGLGAGIAFDEHGGARSGMGIDTGVIDGESLIVVGNFSGQKMSVFRYEGDGLFSDVASSSGIGVPSLRTLTFGLFLFDADLDGTLEILAANGHVQGSIDTAEDGATFRQAPHIFAKADNGTFVDRSAAWGLDREFVARGAAYADYDRDGDLDVLITENGGPVHLYRNDARNERSDGPAYLRVSLEGVPGGALGTRILAYVDGRRQERRVRTGSSYLSASERIVTFGLGSHQRADSLLIYWPTGDVQRLIDVPGNQTVYLGTRRGDALEAAP